MPIKQIAIYGSGGFGREVAWLAENCPDYEVACFIDDDPLKNNQVINDIPVVSFENACRDLSKNSGIVSAIGSPKIRCSVMEKVHKAGFETASLIHPRTELSRWVDMGEGVVICAGCILTTNIKIGNHVQINLDCTIGHDVIMDDYSTLAPGVHLSGYVSLGKRVYVGTGAVFLNGTKENPLFIGDDVVIGAGACVTKSVTSGTWGGCPQEKLENPDPEISESSSDRFRQWQYPDIVDGQPTALGWHWGLTLLTHCFYV